MLSAAEDRERIMYRRLLAPMLLGRVDGPALQLAGTLAASFDAGLGVLVGSSKVASFMPGWEYLPEGVYESIMETARAAAAALALDVRTRLSTFPVQYDLVECGSLWLTPGEQALPHAHAADLVVHGRAAHPDGADRRFFATLLLSSGRPVLVVPPSERPKAFERILVAWKPGREAVRALQDALPLLRRAQRVELVAVTPDDDALDGSGGYEPPDAVLEHLAAHGVVATANSTERGGQGAGQALIAYARRNEVDLVVAGGYGRSRAAEQVFGGVTRTLFESADMPVLFSH